MRRALPQRAANYEPAFNVEKLTILTTLKYYLPGSKAGGSLRTVCNFADALGDDFDIRIVSMDRDLGDTEPYRGVKIDEWQRVGKAQVYYVSPRNQGVRALARLMNETHHDVLYLNSFFSPVFTIKPLLAMRIGLARRVPTVLAPRGEFSEGAIRLKYLKKKTYLNVYKALLFREPILFQASTPMEVTDIARNLGPKTSIFVARDIVCRHEAKGLSAPEGDALQVCFISRISPKKNLKFALEILSRVKVPVVFDIYGTIEDKPYWKECLKIIERMPPNVRVNSCGAIGMDEVVGAFSRHDLFLFPTFGENFGHVIMESLLAGTPVLVSDTTPWKDLEKQGSGWVLPLGDVERWARIVDELAATDRQARLAVRKAIREQAATVGFDEGVLRDNKELFIRAVEMRGSAQA
jgi:glycosyltransferase involved in cell wall biosynthesis